MHADAPKDTGGSLLAVIWGGHEAYLQLSALSGNAAQSGIVLDPFSTLAQLPAAAGLTLIPAIPGDADGQVEMIRYTASGLVSLTHATPELAAHVPNIGTPETAGVDLIAPDALDQALSTHPHPIRLWLDAPGAELTVLTALKDTVHFDDISEIALRCGTAAFFEGAAPCNKIIEWLKNHHFTIARRVDDDPAWPQFLFKPDLQSRKTAKLQATVLKLQAEAATLREQLEASQADITLLKATAQADHAAARKMQDIAQADLKQLRGRYHAGEEIRHQQAELLRMLAPKLKRATQKLAELSGDVDKVKKTTDA